MLVDEFLASEYQESHNMLGCVQAFNGFEYVPISAPGQNSRNEKNIRTSITDRSLHLLSKSVTRRVREELVNQPNDILPAPGIFFLYDRILTKTRDKG